MKRKIIAVAVLLCLITAFVLPAVRAAGEISFTAINNDVQPISDKTMPKYFGDTLYIPYAFFSSDELGVYVASGNDLAMLYSYTSGYKSLTFDIVSATVFDQDNNQKYFPAIKSNGLIYVPVYDVCRYFGLTLNVYAADPAPVVRVTNGSDVLNKLTFFSFNMKKMREYYDAYVGVQASPGTTTPTAPPTPVSPSEEPTYESVSIYLSFFSLHPKSFSAVLDALDTYRIKSCFFVSADEVSENAGLLRRAAGAGHMLGIWLKDGTFDEYQEASALLFEATKIRTILISASGDAATTAEDLVSSNGLVFWHPTRTYDESSKLAYTAITGKLTVLNGNRESINFACTDKAASLTGSLLYYLTEKQYGIKPITEKTSPTKSI